MMLGRARVGIRYRRAVAALTRLILLALVGMVASMGLNVSATHVRIAGRDRLIGTVGTAGQRPRFRCLSVSDTTTGPRNDLTIRPASLIKLITRALHSALWRLRAAIVASTQAPTLGFPSRRR